MQLQNHGPVNFLSMCRYLRIKGIECNRMAIKYSDRRNTAICNHNEPARGEQVREILSDQTDHNYPLFNTGWKPGEKYDASFLRTVAAGLKNYFQKGLFCTT